MSALHSIESIRQAEELWLARLPRGTLMERAAHAVSQQAERMLRALPRATRAVALLGSGNNGGDALLALDMLRRRGYPVAAVALLAPPPQAGDAAAVWQRWCDDGETIASASALEPLLATKPLLIDGLFGIGLARPLSSELAAMIGTINESGCPVLSVDVPSGIDAQTGAIVGGKEGIAISAAVTVTMIADKPGLRTGAALDHVGRVVIATLDLPELQVRAHALLYQAQDAMASLGSRAPNTNKGSFGSVNVIGGSAGTTGAALLAALGAQAAGAGKVYIASPDSPVFDPSQPQLMTRTIESAFEGVDAICVGCGLGTTNPARQAVMNALSCELPLAIDADALNLIAVNPDLADALRARSAASVLTPHPLEAARLLGCTTAQIQADRIAAAGKLSQLFDSHVVLKGAGTVVATPSGDCSINASGSAALATAGTGDVLAGLIATLLAQGLAPQRAAQLGVWLHGDAGQRWHARHTRGIGLSAAQLPNFLIEAINQR